MKDSFKFDYFYGSQAEQFSFFRLPKILIRDERFKKISSDAKILYGIMLDRMSLSRENKWMDQNNRVYIIFTLKEVKYEKLILYDVDYMVLKRYNINRILLSLKSRRCYYEYSSICGNPPKL